MLAWRAAVGMPAQEQPPGGGQRSLQGGGGTAETPAVTLCVATIGRTLRPRLKVRQVAAQHYESAFGESFRHGDEQGRLASGSRAVREHEGAIGGGGRTVQESAYRHRRVDRKRVRPWFCALSWLPSLPASPHYSRKCTTLLTRHACRRS